jgi:hypothetical protein
VLAIKTLWLVNAEHLTAFRADPTFFFSPYEMPCAEFSDALKVGDHAHAVLVYIPLIQMFQPVAGKAVTTKAVFSFAVRQFFAVFDFASCTGF